MTKLLGQFHQELLLCWHVILLIIQPYDKQIYMAATSLPDQSVRKLLHERRPFDFIIPSWSCSNDCQRKVYFPWQWALCHRSLLLTAKAFEQGDCHVESASNFMLFSPDAWILKLWHRVLHQYLTDIEMLHKSLLGQKACVGFYRLYRFLSTDWSR
jgi:hypothetical protein